MNAHYGLGDEAAVVLEGFGNSDNRDVADKIENASQKNNLPDLLSKVDIVQQTQTRLAANTNLRLTMESLLIQLAQPQGANR